MIGWQEAPKKSLLSIGSEIVSGIEEGNSVNEVIRSVRQTEEIRLGLLFLQKKAGISEVIKGLTKTAEAILSICIKDMAEGPGNMAILGFGKLGGREISFNSDLDVIIVSSDETGQFEARSAERFLRMLISYTREGIAYRVDTRLRPEGSKGPLVSSVESLRKYYAKAAAFWEFQALLKARPVAGNRGSGLAFMQMAKNTLLLRGREIIASDIRQMRERILRELSKEPEGYDIKLGPGGIEEIEFTVQYLQLLYCGQHEKLLVQGTMPALRRLEAAGLMQKEEVFFLKDAYLFYRTLESFLRLRSEGILRREDDKLFNAAGFMGYSDVDEFVARLEQTRKKAGEIYDIYVAGH
jgi:glutamate-ammonia-ligase adenylyltransferase